MVTPSRRSLPGVDISPFGKLERLQSLFKCSGKTHCYDDEDNSNLEKPEAEPGILHKWPKSAIMLRAMAIYILLAAILFVR